MTKGTPVIVLGLRATRGNITSVLPSHLNYSANFIVYRVFHEYKSIV